MVVLYYTKSLDVFILSYLHTKVPIQIKLNDIVKYNKYVKYNEVY